MSHGRDARSGRIVVAGGERLHRGKASNADAADGTFRSTCNHDIGIVELDQPCGIADRMRAGRAGSDRCVIGALEAKADRDLTAHQIDQGGRYEERADFSRTARMQVDCGIGDRAEPTDAGADHDAGTFARIVVLGLPARIPDGFARSGNAIENKGIVAPDILRGHDRIGIKNAFAFLRDQSRDLGRQVIDFEPIDPPEPALAGDQAAPANVGTGPEWRDEAYTGDHNASCRHAATYYTQQNQQGRLKATFEEPRSHLPAIRYSDHFDQYR